MALAEADDRAGVIAALTTGPSKADAGIDEYPLPSAAVVAILDVLEAGADYGRPPPALMELEQAVLSGGLAFADHVEVARLVNLAAAAVKAEYPTPNGMSALSVADQMLSAILERRGNRSAHAIIRAAAEIGEAADGFGLAVGWAARHNRKLCLWLLREPEASADVGSGVMATGDWAGVDYAAIASQLAPADAAAAAALLVPRLTLPAGHPGLINDTPQQESLPAVATPLAVTDHVLYYAAIQHAADAAARLAAAAAEAKAVPDEQVQVRERTRTALAIEACRPSDTKLAYELFEAGGGTDAGSSHAAATFAAVALQALRSERSDGTGESRGATGEGIFDNIEDSPGLGASELEPDGALVSRIVEALTRDGAYGPVRTTRFDLQAARPRAASLRELAIFDPDVFCARAANSPGLVESDPSGVVPIGPVEPSTAASLKIAAARHSALLIPYQPGGPSSVALALRPATANFPFAAVESEATVRSVLPTDQAVLDRVVLGCAEICSPRALKFAAAVVSSVRDAVDSNNGRPISELLVSAEALGSTVGIFLLQKDPTTAAAIASECVDRGAAADVTARAYAVATAVKAGQLEVALGWNLDAVFGKPLASASDVSYPSVPAILGAIPAPILFSAVCELAFTEQQEIAIGQLCNLFNAMLIADAAPAPADHAAACAALSHFGGASEAVELLDQHYNRVSESAIQSGCTAILETLAESRSIGGFRDAITVLDFLKRRSLLSMESANPIVLTLKAVGSRDDLKPAAELLAASEEAGMPLSAEAYRALFAAHRRLGRYAPALKLYEHMTRAGIAITPDVASLVLSAASQTKPLKLRRILQIASSVKAEMRAANHPLEEAHYIQMLTICARCQSRSGFVLRLGAAQRIVVFRTYPFGVRWLRLPAHLLSRRKQGVVLYVTTSPPSYVEVANQACHPACNLTAPPSYAMLQA